MDILHVFYDDRMLLHEPPMGIFDSGKNPPAHVSFPHNPNPDPHGDGTDANGDNPNPNKQNHKLTLTPQEKHAASTKRQKSDEKGSVFGGLMAVLDRHPENGDRIRNIEAVLKRGPLAGRMQWHEGREADVEKELLKFHTKEYVDLLQEANKDGSRHLCGGTYMMEETWHCALLAAGTTVAAMEYILSGKGNLCYALVRPPGHHAQRNRADGYCFLNNAAIAVQKAMDEFGVKRVAVVDIDVHSGNGMADAFFSSKDVLTVSLHMDHGSWGDSHPQSLQANEVGEGEGLGFNLNVPLPNGAGDKGYEMAILELVLPDLEKFRPEVIVVPFGQDANQFDPNGRQCLTMDGFRRIGALIRDAADRLCHSKLLLVQEGGYQITYSALCVHALIEGVLGLDASLEDPIAYYPEDIDAVKLRISQARRARDDALFQASISKCSKEQ